MNQIKQALHERTNARTHERRQSRDLIKFIYIDEMYRTLHSLTLDSIREFRIERRHIAALTWGAMFRSRSGAILAGGGGGLFASKTVWRPAEVGCSVSLLTILITIVCRKPGISSVFRKKQIWLFIKKDERSGGHQAYLN